MRIIVHHEDGSSHILSESAATALTVGVMMADAHVRPERHASAESAELHALMLKEPPYSAALAELCHVLRLFEHSPPLPLGPTKVE